MVQCAASGSYTVHTLHHVYVRFLCTAANRNAIASSGLVACVGKLLPPPSLGVPETMS